MKKLFLFLVLLFVCTQAYAGTKYGAGVDESAKKVKVADVFLKKELMGQKVTLEGRIVSQCQSNGCWFFIQDETAQVFVDLKKNNFTLPHMLSKTVAVSGTVDGTKYDIKLIATGVEVK